MLTLTTQPELARMTAITTPALKKLSFGKAWFNKKATSRSQNSGLSATAAPAPHVREGALSESAATTQLAKTGVHPVMQVIWEKARRMSISSQQMKAYVQQQFGVSTSKNLNDVQIALLAETFESIDTQDEFEMLLHSDASLS